MKVMTILLVSLIMTITSSCATIQEGKHLFIFSGQSNMKGLRPQESFIPKVEAEYGRENIILVKDAVGGQPIRRWYKDWKPLEGHEPVAQADLYDSLMIKVNKAIEKVKIKTVTFIWMQGEADARQKLGEVYEKSLIGLYKQLSNDLKRKDVNFVIGRLSDHDMANGKYPDWTMIRDVQEKVAQSNPRFDWVNTDDLNDGVNRRGEKIINDLHMTKIGYEIMGERFADKAIKLIEKTN